jgi:UDP-N-acetylglucosamine--N-acetylmuramyl-(pentapeptide) pyrophosphoryl-undecaprenol N-acetylglucosamine transferase
MTNFLLAGGGTGGHVNPLLALAEHIRSVDSNAQIIALGTREGLESRLVPERGFELQTIARLPFPRKPSLYALQFPGKFLKAVAEIQALIKARSVDVVVGFGGYASAPAYVAARRSGIPYVIHEANALPGMANRMGASKASAVGVAFASTKLPKAVHVGMPLRTEIESAINSSNQAAARAHFGLNPNTPTLLVTGGSLGARSINQAVHAAEAILDAAGVQVLHIVGGNSELEEIRTKSLVRIKYCDRMDLAIAAASLAIARSGASTVCEFGAFGLPSVFVPYPVGNGEQRLNAADLVAAGGAVVVEDAKFTSEFVASQVIPLISNNKRLLEMTKAAKKGSIADGTKRLYELTLAVLTGKKASGK